MKTKLALGLVLSTFLAGSIPAFAQDVMPGMTGTTTMGEAMVDAKGMALYTSEADTAGKSMCNGDCAKAWVPLAVAAGAKASGDWTIVTRDDGTMMWALKGMPLYTYVKDTKAGEVTGDKMNGFHLAM